MNPALEGVAGAAPSLAMLAAIACLIGGIYLLRTGGDRTKGVLMLVMSVVLVGNVLIWTI